MQGRTHTLSFSCISRILLMTSRGLMPAQVLLPSASKQALCKVYPASSLPLTVCACCQCWGFYGVTLKCVNATHYV